MNGRPDRLPEHHTVADVVRGVTGDPEPRGIAVARNGTVVRRADWAATVLAYGDRIEVLTATQGG